MEAATPIDLLFGEMDQLGPGSDAHTLHVLHRLPRQRFGLIVDAGCGTGRQTLALARELQTPIHALDTHVPFLHTLRRRAHEAGLDHLVHPLAMDMIDLPDAFQQIDLLWSEGAAYHIGFGQALATWATALAPGGFVVVSELSWLTEAAPAIARDFFRSGYPGMRSVPQNRAVAEQAGYRVRTTHTLPPDAWVDGYYNVLAPRATTLLAHPDPAVRALAAETIEEIKVFGLSEGSYGYVFYVLQQA